MKKQIELYNQIRTTADKAKQNALMQQIIDIAEDNFFAIGTVNALPSTVIVNDKLRNVPEAMPESYNLMTPAPMRVGQLWFDNK